jgi:hypothetical protein
METIFTVTNEDLSRLSPHEAVELFRELLWAEARRIGLPTNRVTITSQIYVPDGGVDASIQSESPLPASGLIKVGITSFQIKAGTSFEPWQDSQIKKELFGDKTPDKNNLGSGVKHSLDNNGTYILACFKQDPTSEQIRHAVEHLNNYLTEIGYQNPRVEVFGQSTIIGMLKIFPSLALKANRHGIARFQTHQSWSQEAEMRETTKPFRMGVQQQEFIQNLQGELRKGTEAVHIRVWGEPGIGKTRLVLEATRADDLKPLVIYCDSASKFRDSDLMNEILRDDNPFSAILVIDECDPDGRSYIWNKLKYCGPRIKLVSIYNEYDSTSGNTLYMVSPPLANEQISQIIEGYSIPKDGANRWLEMCSGSPRVAHVIGWNLNTNQEDILKSPDTVDVWERYVIGGDNPDNSDVQHRKLVLRHIALFKRFGYGRSVIREAQAIAKKVNAADPHITWERFQEVVQALRERKILQGEHTLYITPRALHIKLWTDWWEAYGPGFDFDKFLEGLPPTLVKWFQEMFKYAQSSRAAADIVKELLGERGSFKDEN